MMEEIYNFLKTTLLEMGIDDTEISADSPLSYFEFDSTEKVDLALAIKQNYDIKIKLTNDDQTLSQLAQEILTNMEK